MDSDGLSNWAGGDVDPESNGRGPRLFDDRVTVDTAAGGTQGVEILIRRPFRQPGGNRGAVSDVDGNTLDVGLNQPVLADGIAAHAGDGGDIMIDYIGGFRVHDDLPGAGKDVLVLAYACRSMAAPERDSGLHSTNSLITFTGYTWRTT